MEISEAFDKYTAEVALANAYQSAIRKAADKELQDLIKQEGLLRQAKMQPNKILGMQNLAFRTADTGQYHFYAFKDYTIEVMKDALVLRTNRQYQWLLAEVYELFEDFLEHFYACAAMENKNLWPLRDFGNISLDELYSIGFEMLLKLAKDKKGKPKSLLSPLREKIPRIKVLEKINKLNVNLWFAVNFIEKLRHHIVHTKGIVSDKNKFIDDLMKKVGLYNNGRPDQEHLELINLVLQQQDGKHFVRLLEIPLLSNGPVRSHVNVFNELSNHLLAYSHVLVTSFTQVQSKKPK